MRSVSRAGRSGLGWAPLWFGVMVLVGGPALGETGNGTKNFHAPPTVPNYFSNEAGPMIGGPAESRRVDLYPNPAAAPRQLDAVTTSPWPRTRHAVTAHGRTRVAARTRDGHLPLTAARGRTRAQVAARGGPPSHGRHTTTTRTTHVNNVHHRGRG